MKRPERPLGPGSARSSTIYDVAALAGVSASTVSRALNNDPRISAPTVAKITDASAKLGFQINPAARALLTGRTMTIGLVVADIANPVALPIIRGAERAAAEAGFTLIISESQKSGAAEAETARSLMRNVDGLVLAMTWLSDREILELAHEKRLALVNRHVDGVPSAVPDVVPGIGALLDHLAERGHRRVAYLSGPAPSWINRCRWTAINTGAVLRGVSIVEVPGAPPTVDGGSSALDRVRATRATAVIAFNDLMAFGLLQRASRLGVDVPRQLAVAGFDNMFGGELIRPTLTTVSAPLEQIAEQAVVLLTGAVGEKTTFPTWLTRRESS